MSNYLKNIIDKLSPESRRCLDAAVSLAISRTHYEVEVEHLLQELIVQQQKMMHTLCARTGLVLDSLLRALQQTMKELRAGNNQSPVFSNNLVEWLEKSWLFTSTCQGQDFLTPSALISCLLDQTVTPDFASKLRHLLICDHNLVDNILSKTEAASLVKLTDSDHRNSLSLYTRNLSKLARTGDIDPILGRDDEIRQMIDVLLRRRQNNPILTGEPGVGKTALVEGLALRIASGHVPDSLKSVELFALDLGLLQAGASIKGEFEKRLQSLLDDISSYPQPVILFVDEAHMLIGSGGVAGQNDAANLLKPALARGEIRMIAATTWAEYKKFFQKDAALTRRFQIVQVKEPDMESAIAMLRALAPIISAHHNVQIMESAINAAVTLSTRYITGRKLPDKSVSLLDTACARVAVSQHYEPKQIESINSQLLNLYSEKTVLEKECGHEKRLIKINSHITELEESLSILLLLWEKQRNIVNKLLQIENEQEKIHYRAELCELHKIQTMVFECVDASCIADVISTWTGIPLGRMLEKTSQQLNELLPRLEERIIGQKHALTMIATQIRISRTNLHDPLKPTGVFMLAGPSGTGKTESALALADLIYGGDQGLLTINMSEYQEAHSVAGLKGSPPGYVGYGQGGVLTEAIKKNPYRVVLLDEVEKAHPDVMELFYQIFDKGVIDDAEGEQINFRHTLIIMTSNLGSSELVTAYTEGERSIEALCNTIRPLFDHVFRPALMGRITLIPFLPLENDVLKRIISLKIEHICKRFQDNTSSEKKLCFSEQVIEWVAENCKLSQSGARDIDQILRQHLLPLLADCVLNKEDSPSDVLKFDINKGKLKVDYL